MSRTLVVAFGPADVAPATGVAASLGHPYDVLLLTGDAPAPGAGRLITTNLAEVPPSDAAATGIHSLADSYTSFVSASSMASKDVMARLAGLLDAAMVTDIVAIEGPGRFVRPVVAGAALATVETLGHPVVLTFRPASFGPADGPSPAAEPMSLPFEGTTTRVGRSGGTGGRPDLTQAKVVVSGGRPLGDAATFEKLIGGLADKLGGAVGATRAAVDNGIAPNELQVGQTGKVVAPDLYIAAGISGSTQHMAGIKDSKVIVAINKDPEAPIFEAADLGLVADLFDAVPELTDKV
ncbi:MAG: FAD-binding protein [Fimbriimonadaceae bacterium]|nr:FAD-binding protein [Fimbriimonadaceae bacterium]